MLEIKDFAPEFSLKNQDDIEISLKDFRGKWVILYFYPKDDTPGCTIEACDFTTSIPNFEALDAVILGLSPDTPATHRKFIEKFNIQFTLVCDIDNEVSKLYDAYKLKKLYGREYMGVVRSTFLIDTNGNIAAIWRDVKVDGHIKEVEKTLKELKN